MVGCPSSVSCLAICILCRNKFGVATITRTNFIWSVSNFGNSSNMSEIGQLELGYLPLNFPHFWGVATITWTNIIRSVSNSGNKKVSRNYRSCSNMSKIGQPVICPWISSLFPIFEVLQRKLEQILCDLFQTLEIRRSLGNAGRLWIWAESVNRNWVICP